MGEAAEVLDFEPKEVATRALSIIDQGKAVVIRSAADYKAAGELWITIKGVMKQADDAFDPIVSKTNLAHKEAVAQKAKIYNPLKEVYVFVKGAMSKWDQEQEIIRKAEERKLQEAQRKAAEEQALLDAIAAEEEARRNGATKEEAAQEAAAIIDEPVYVPPVVLPKETPKMAGGPVYRTIWKARIVDESKIPRQYLVPDMVKINGVVRSLKNQANIPGVQADEVRV